MHIHYRFYLLIFIVLSLVGCTNKIALFKGSASSRIGGFVKVSSVDQAPLQLAFDAPMVIKKGTTCVPLTLSLVRRFNADGLTFSIPENKTGEVYLASQDLTGTSFSTQKDCSGANSYHVSAQQFGSNPVVYYIKVPANYSGASFRVSTQVNLAGSSFSKEISVAVSTTLATSSSLPVLTTSQYYGASTLQAGPDGMQLIGAKLVATLNAGDPTYQFLVLRNTTVTPQNAVENFVQTGGWAIPTTLFGRSNCGEGAGAMHVSAACTGIFHIEKAGSPFLNDESKRTYFYSYSYDGYTTYYYNLNYDGVNGASASVTDNHYITLQPTIEMVEIPSTIQIGNPNAPSYLPRNPLDYSTAVSASTVGASPWRDLVPGSSYLLSGLSKQVKLITASSGNTNLCLLNSSATNCEVFLDLGAIKGAHSLPGNIMNPQLSNFYFYDQNILVYESSGKISIYGNYHDSPLKKLYTQQVFTSEEAQKIKQIVPALNAPLKSMGGWPSATDAITWTNINGWDRYFMKALPYGTMAWVQFNDGTLKQIDISINLVGDSYRGILNGITSQVVASGLNSLSQPIPGVNLGRTIEARGNSLFELWTPLQVLRTLADGTLAWTMSSPQNPSTLYSIPIVRLSKELDWKYAYVTRVIKNNIPITNLYTNSLSDRVFIEGYDVDGVTPTQKSVVLWTSADLGSGTVKNRPLLRFKTVQTNKVALIDITNLSSNMAGPSFLYSGEGNVTSVIIPLPDILVMSSSGVRQYRITTFDPYRTGNQHSYEW